MGAGEEEVFAFAQVSKHSSFEDCWFIIGDRVYDVTNFMTEHPGGPSVFVGVAGKDATDDFEQVGHSVSAKEMMNKYSVGKIDSSTIPAKKAHTPLKQPHVTDESTMKILQFLIPLMIIGLALGIHFYLKST